MCHGCVLVILKIMPNFSKQKWFIVALINPDVVYPNMEGGDINVCVCAGWDSRWWLVVDLRQ